MSDWEEDDAYVAKRSTSTGTGTVAISSSASNANDDWATAENRWNGHQNDSNDRNRWKDRGQSGDRRNRGESNDRRPNDRFDGGDAISFEIDHSMVGKIIGRGGNKIREIQEKYNVNLNIGMTLTTYGHTFFL